MDLVGDGSDVVSGVLEGFQATVKALIHAIELLGYGEDGGECADDDDDFHGRFASAHPVL